AFTPAADAPGSQADAAGGAGPKADEEGDKGDNGDKGDATQGAWRYRIGEFALDGGEVAFRDASVDPAGAIGLHDIRVAARALRGPEARAGRARPRDRPALAEPGGAAAHRGRGDLQLGPAALWRGRPAL